MDEDNLIPLDSPDISEHLLTVLTCDVCQKYLTSDGGQRTADTVVCEECVKRMTIRTMKSADRVRFPGSIGHQHPQ